MKFKKKNYTEQFAKVTVYCYDFLHFKHCKLQKKMKKLD